MKNLAKAPTLIGAFFIAYYKITSPQPPLKGGASEIPPLREVSRHNVGTEDVAFMKEIISHNIADTAQFAQEFLVGLTPQSDWATVVGLYGDLGSGKTFFVQQIAKALGVRGSVQSPTFVIVKSYKLKVKSFNTLIHVDAYRLEKGEELRKLEFQGLLADHRNLIFIEWAERVAGILPPDHIKLHFEFVNDTTRKISKDPS